MVEELCQITTNQLLSPNDANDLSPCFSRSASPPRFHIEKLKNDLQADGFCMKDSYATAWGWNPQPRFNTKGLLATGLPTARIVEVYPKKTLRQTTKPA
jgi:hypothetical protein